MDKYRDAVSGKERGKRAWVDPKKVEEQKDFLDRAETKEKGFAVEGHGHTLQGRTDLSNQGEQLYGSNLELQVHEALKRGPWADVAQVEVRALGNVVHLYGTAENAKEIRECENICLNVPGVASVVNHLTVRTGDEPLRKIH